MVTTYWIVVFAVIYFGRCVHSEECISSKGRVICSGGDYCCDSNTRCCSGLNIGQKAAIGIGAAVVLALIIIGIVAAVMKFKKGPTAKVKPEQDDQQRVSVPRDRKDSIYEDPPPQYSLHAPNVDPPKPSLPPDFETFQTKPKL